MDGSAVTDGCAVTARSGFVTDQKEQTTNPAADAARSRFKPGPNILQKADGRAAAARGGAERRHTDGCAVESPTDVRWLKSDNSAKIRPNHTRKSALDGAACVISLTDERGRSMWRGSCENSGRSAMVISPHEEERNTRSRRHRDGTDVR
jgi:hypothetical protein